MREWVTLLVTVILVTSSSCEHAEDGHNYEGSEGHYGNGASFDKSEEQSLSSLSEEKSFQISKGQEKLLKDFPGIDKQVKHGKGHKKQSESEFVLSEERYKRKYSSESSDRRQKGKHNMWTNYARGKYGVDESVDLSILKTTARKATEKHKKDVVKIKRGKDRVKDIKQGNIASRQVTTKIKDKKLASKKTTVKSKPRKQSESHSEILDQMEFDFPSKSDGLNTNDENDVKGLREKNKDSKNGSRKKSGSEVEDEMVFNLFSKYVSKEKQQKGKIVSNDISGIKKTSGKKINIKSEESENDKDHDNEDDLEGQTYETSVHQRIDKHRIAKESREYESKHHEKDFRGLKDKEDFKESDYRKKLSLKKVKPTEKKTNVKSEMLEEEAYEDDDFGGQTYETSSGHKPKDKIASAAKSEEYEDEEKSQESRTKELKEHRKQHTDYKDTRSNIRYESKSKMAGKKTKSKENKRKNDAEGAVKKVKETKDKTKKAKKTAKEKKKKYTTTPYVKKETSTADLAKEIKKKRHGSLEEDVYKESRETLDPLEMSTEELMRYHEMNDEKTISTQQTTLITTELFKPTTLRPSVTDHWICPSDVKSKTIEINWSNYDSHGQKRIEESVIEPKFRNKMKRFSTKELKGRLKQVARRAQRKGDASFDASAALKRVRFNEVFKVKPIDDDDIFRNVTYQPTCSREFEVRMLEKNYRQKYGRRQGTEEMQREFEYMLQFMGNNSKALSEETCNRIQEEEFTKLLACCDTKEISSLMADFRDSSPHKIKYLKSKGKLPLTTSEELDAMEKAEDPEHQKRARYKAAHKNKGKLKEKDLAKVEMFPGEHKDMDKEYIANTEEVNRPLVSRTAEEEEVTEDNQGLTYFPGGRFINTEELNEMKKENEYYERMKKIGGRITRLYDPKNTLSSSEWAALEATTMKRPRWSKPAPKTKVTVRGRRRRSVSGQSKESLGPPHLVKGQSKQSPGHSIESAPGGNGKTTKQRGPIKDTVSEKKLTDGTSKIVSIKSEEFKEHSESVAESSGRSRIIGTRQKASKNSDRSKAHQEWSSEAMQSGKIETQGSTAEGTTPMGETNKQDAHIVKNSHDEWSSISSKNSEFFLDDRKQLRRRKSTDKRYNMVVNIIKRHARLKYNRSDWYFQTLTRRTEKRPTTPMITLDERSTRIRRRISTRTYMITPDWNHLMDSKNEKKLEAFEKDYDDLVKHAKLFERRRKGFTSDEYFGSASPRPRPDWGPTIRSSQIDSLSIEPDKMRDSEIIQYMVDKEERVKAEKAALFPESEERKAKATWYKMKLHQFFYKYNITKDEWQRMMNPENRHIFNATHQRYTNLKREFFVMPTDVWDELYKRNITSEEFKTFNKKNRVMIKFCRGQRLNYSARKRAIRKPRNTTKRLGDIYDAYMDAAEKHLPDCEEEEEDTPSFIEKKTKRLRGKKNLTDAEEIYLALGGPLPYNPDFWPESFLRSDEVINEMKKQYEDDREFENKDKKEKRRIINERIIKRNEKELEEYEKYKSLIEQGKMKTTPRDIWQGYTGIRKKIWEYYVKESEEKRKAKEAKKSPKQFQENNEKKIQMDLERDFNETTKSKKLNSNLIKVTKYNVEKHTRKKFDDASREYKYKYKSSKEYKYKSREMRKKVRKPIVGNRMTPKNEISRRERGKKRDRKKYGSEYSKIVKEKYWRKSQGSYYSRSRESRIRDDKRRHYDSRERKPKDRHDRIRGRRKDVKNERRRYSDNKDSRKYVDSRDRRSSSSDRRPVKPKRQKTNKARPERFRKKKPEKKKKKRSRRDIFGVRSTTVEPIFHESRSEYQGKMVIDAAWLKRRRAYLAEKYARLSREEKEKVLRQQGKLKEGETISTKKPTTEYKIHRKPIDARELEFEFMMRGLTKRADAGSMADTPSFDEAQYEKAEQDYIRRKKTHNRDSSDSDESRTAPPTHDPRDYFYVDRYEKEEKIYMDEMKRKNESSGSYSYYSNVDKSYVTDHNPDYGSEDRMRKIEENLIIDYKNKEVHYKNSPRVKYPTENMKATIPTWPTKWKNRGVRPQDRKLCFFNPSTTNQYRQVLYVYHKYKQLKEAFDRKENIDDIPSLDSDY